MAPKLPAKFDDISKTASDVLGLWGLRLAYELKATQKTEFGGATSEILVDLFPQGESCSTPAKLTLKLPKLLDMLDGLSIDKLEFGKDGKTQMECSLSNKLHKVDGLKVEVKSNPAFSNLTYCTTYTGMSNFLVKTNTEHADPTNSSVECLHATGPAVVGVKFNGMSNLCPSAGVNVTMGRMFASVTARSIEGLRSLLFTGYGVYKVSDDIKVASTYQHGGQNGGTFAVGGSANVADMTVKANINSDNQVVLAVKKELAKGTTFLGGMSYGLKDGRLDFGAKLEIE